MLKWNRADFVSDRQIRICDLRLAFLNKNYDNSKKFFVVERKTMICCSIRVMRWELTRI